MLNLTKCNLNYLERAALSPHLEDDEEARRLETPWDDYYITTHGNVISTKNRKIKFIKPVPGANGYNVVCLHASDDRKPSVEYVHRLMVKAFYGITTNYQLQTRHLDGNKTNNCLANLLHGTAAENAQDKVMHGTALFGENVGTSKLREKDVKAIRSLWNLRGQHNIPSNLTLGALGRMFRISECTVSNVVNNKTWKHVGD
mgnify:CR=1 FL=1